MVWMTGERWAFLRLPAGLPGIKGPGNDLCHLKIKEIGAFYYIRQELYSVKLAQWSPEIKQ